MLRKIKSGFMPDWSKVRVKSGLKFCIKLTFTAPYQLSMPPSESLRTTDEIQTLRTYDSLILILIECFSISTEIILVTDHIITLSESQYKLDFHKKVLVSKSFVLRYKSHLLCIRVNFHTQASKFISLVPN